MYLQPYCNYRDSSEFNLLMWSRIRSISNWVDDGVMGQIFPKPISQGCN